MSSNHEYHGYCGFCDCITCVNAEECQPCQSCDYEHQVVQGCLDYKEEGEDNG